MASGYQEQWKENLNAQLVCRDCKEMPPKLVEEFSSGDMVCASCGLVLAEKTIDTRSEWRTFANDDQGNDDPSRVGDAANPLLDGAQLETSIAYERGGSGQSRDLYRAQNKSSHDKSNKSLSVAYKELGDLCESMDLTQNVTTYAKFLYKQIYDAGAFRGKPLESINAGLILIACRQQHVDRTFREIYHATKVPKADIGRTFKALEKFFATDRRIKNAQLEKDGGKSGVKYRSELLCITDVMKKHMSTPRMTILLPNPRTRRNWLPDSVTSSTCLIAVQVLLSR